MYFQTQPDSEAGRQYGFITMQDGSTAGLGGLNFGVSTDNAPTEINWVFSLTSPIDTNESTQTGLLIAHNRWISSSYPTSGTWAGANGRCERFGYLATVAGQGSAVFGVRANAGSQSVVMGHWATALGNIASAVAIGYEVACAGNSVAIGSYASVAAASSVAIGSGPTAGTGAETGTNGSVAIGYDSYATGTAGGIPLGAIAIGPFMSVSGRYSVGIGTGTINANYSCHIGSRTTTQTGIATVGIGHGFSGNMGTGSILISGYNGLPGLGGRAHGQYTVAVGYRIYSYGDNNVVLGRDASDGPALNGYDSVFVVGYSAIATAPNQIFFGGNVTGNHYDTMWLGTGQEASNLREDTTFTISSSQFNSTASIARVGTNLRLQGGRGSGGAKPGYVVFSTAIHNSTSNGSFQVYYDRAQIDVNGTLILQNLSSTANGIPSIGGIPYSNIGFQQAAAGVGPDLFANDFKLPFKLEHTASTYTQIFLSNGTTPNGAVTGSRGDMCYNGDSLGTPYLCDGDGAGSTGTIWYAFALATPYVNANNVRTVTDTNTNINATGDYIVFCQPNTVNMIATLPDPTTCVDRIFKISRDISSTTYSLNVNSAGGYLINGLSLWPLNTTYQQVTVISRGASGWRVIS
jgi:hypothetical protein